MAPDLAQLCGVLNQAVKRKIQRFPDGLYVTAD
ncbi:MAG: ORF6N domain-containing protein [Bacteroides sp.]|nr:ORF6N domain-containing protein [Bacteroides sp.]